MPALTTVALAADAAAWRWCAARQDKPHQRRPQHGMPQDGTAQHTASPPSRQAALRGRGAGSSQWQSCKGDACQRLAGPDLQTQQEPVCNKAALLTVVAARPPPVNAAQGWHALLLKFCCCAEAARNPLLLWLWLLIDDAWTCSSSSGQGCMLAWCCCTPADHVCCCVLGMNAEHSMWDTRMDTAWQGTRASLTAHLAAFDHLRLLSGALSAAAGCMLLAACQDHKAPLLLLPSAADIPAGRPRLVPACLIRNIRRVCDATVSNSRPGKGAAQQKIGLGPTAAA